MSTSLDKIHAFDPFGKRGSITSKYLPFTSPVVCSVRNPSNGPGLVNPSEYRELGSGEV